MSLSVGEMDSAKKTDQMMILGDSAHPAWFGGEKEAGSVAGGFTGLLLKLSFLSARKRCECCGRVRMYLGLCCARC